jgi:hypothetical protein
MPAQELAPILSPAEKLQANYHDDGYPKSLLIRLIYAKKSSICQEIISDSWRRREK